MSQVQIHGNSRCRGGWSAKSLAFLEHVQEVLHQLESYWPLTLRQVYYRLVASLLIENAQSEYARLSRLLVKARLDGLVPWEAMEDRARSTLPSAGWKDWSDFVSCELDDFLTGFRRHLIQSQDVALEVWLEKDALSRIVQQTAFPYCVPVVVARGFSSVSYLHECRKRIEAHAALGKRTEILYFGDQDPSGWEMLPSMLTTLQAEMGLGDLVTGIRCALTPELVEQYDLPRDPAAFKPTDTRARKYMEQFGDLAVELDALPPATLESIIRESIESRLDLERFEAERAREVDDQSRIEGLRSDVHRFVGER
jgi:hypothetical protein